MERFFVRMPLVMLLATAVLAPPTVLAQEIPTIPQPARPSAIAIPGSVASQLTTISDQFTNGQWTDFVASATTLLKSIPGGRFDLSRDYVLLVWEHTLPTDTDPVLLTAVIHDNGVEPYANVLPGLKRGNGAKLLEVFITSNPDPSIASYYVSKPLPDPLLAQIPDVVDKFLGPLFTRLEANGEIRLARPSPAPGALQPAATLFALVRDVRLPESRAGIEVKISASLPGSIGETLKEAEANLKRRGFAITTAQDKALTDALTAMTNAAAVSCAGSPRACREALHDAVTSAVRPIIRDPANDPQRPDVRALESALHAAIDEFKATTVSGTVSLDNVPLTHFGFGLVSAFAARRFGDDQRATIDSNKVSAAPLPRALQIVAFNVSPRGYQAKTTRRWNPRAFLQFFAGVVFAPDIGVAGGASFMLLSNLGVNIGYAHLFISKPGHDLQIGADLSEKTAGGEFKYAEDVRRDPLEAGRSGALFLGVSYNFK